jgi:hypothetical protein
MRGSQPRGLKWICGHRDCDLYHQEQEGDHESVYFAVLCVQCMRPVYGVAGTQKSRSDA